MSTRPDSRTTVPDGMRIGTAIDKPRIKLADLLQQMREIEIDHDGKIYRLRLTQANKLILTA